MGRWRFAARRGVALVLALMASTLVFPRPAASFESTGWESPELLALADLQIGDDGGAYGSTSPQIALSPAGSAVAVWSAANDDRSTPWTATIWAAHFTNGRWDVPVIVGTGASFFPGLDVAVDARGSAIAVWVQVSASATDLIEEVRGTVYASRFVPGPGWGVPTRVGTTGGNDLRPRIAMNPEGNAFVVWLNRTFEQLAGQPAGTMKETDTVWANRFVPGAGWEKPTLIEGEKGGSPDIAVDTWGNAVAGWSWSCECNHTPMVSLYTPVRGWEEPTILPGYAHGVDVAMDSEGTAFALWSFGNAPIWASRFVPWVGWELPVDLAGAQGVRTNPYEVSAAEGTAIAAWSSDEYSEYSGGDTNSQIYASLVVPDAGWQTPAGISAATDLQVLRELQSVSVGSGGDGVVVWVEHDGDRGRVWANQVSREGNWGIAQTISDPTATEASVSNGGSYGHWPAEVAVDREGRAVAIWAQPDGSRMKVWTNRFLSSPSSNVEPGLMALDGGVLVLMAVQVAVAAALGGLVLFVMTLRRRVRAFEETTSEERGPDPPSNGNGGITSRKKPPRRETVSPVPSWRRWPANNAALRLTAKERVLLHLLDFARHLNTTEFPPELTSTGIAMAVGIDGRHVAQYLRPLVKEGLVLEKTARVRGALQRRKVYVLDAEGWRSATGIRERVLFLTVRVRDESGDRQATVAEILAATHGHRNILDVVREANGSGFVNLAAR